MPIKTSLEMLDLDTAQCWLQPNRDSISCNFTDGDNVHFIEIPIKKTWSGERINRR